MVLKSGYDRGKEREPEYRKKCTNCGVEKDKREFADKRGFILIAYRTIGS